MPPPLLYDLTELQRHANRLYGFSAKKTLELAQTLYEQKKLISYPRTDSRHLSHGRGRDPGRDRPRHPGPLPGPARPRHRRAALGPPLRRRRQGHRPPRHHPHRRPRRKGPALAEDEREDLRPVCRRLLSAWHDDHIWSVTTVITAISNPPASGVGEPIARPLPQHRHAVEQVGWKVLDIDRKKDRKKQGRVRRRTRTRTASPRLPEENQSLPPGLSQGQAQEVLDAEPWRRRPGRRSASPRPPC